MNPSPVSPDCVYGQPLYTYAIVPLRGTFFLNKPDKNHIIWRKNKMEANREYKSTLFSGLFNEPDNLRELYNALANTCYGTDKNIFQ